MTKAKLLSRDEFRSAVFSRDNNKCVMCDKPAVDAHHIIERRLFPDQGYYLDNGASVCEQHHILAEQTLLAPDVLRARCGIMKIVLPESLTADESYTKWGDVILKSGQRAPGPLFYDESVQKILAAGKTLALYSHYRKYPRTPHLPSSLGVSHKDMRLTDFKELMGRDVVITEKMDGENTTMYCDKLHARSIDSLSHPSQNWVRQLHGRVAWEIPESWRIVGENLYVKHSISYVNLPSYFMVFAIFNERDLCLSWQDTIEWAKLLNLETVPLLYEGKLTAEVLSHINQFTVSKYGSTREGYVIRDGECFAGCDFAQHVAKFVRENHVAIDAHHWRSKPIIQNSLS